MEATFGGQENKGNHSVTFVTLQTNGQLTVSDMYITLQDISAITSSYTLINMYLCQFEYKKRQKNGFLIK